MFLPNMSKEKYYFLNLSKLVLITFIYFAKYTNKESIYIQSTYYHNEYNYLAERPIDFTDPIIYNEKNILKDYISRLSSSKLPSVKYIYLNERTRFETFIILLSKTIFFCEILKCKRIILNKHYLFKNNLFYRKYKIHISLYNFIDYSYLIIDKSLSFIYYVNILNPEIRIKPFLSEVLANIPQYKINPKDIFIYFRNHQSNIFDHVSPPLCFFESILNSTNTTKIRIISNFDSNPTIEKILSEYNNSVFEQDLSFMDKLGYLSKAYTIISSNDYFIYCIYMINNNLKTVYEFELNYLTIPVYDEEEYFKLFQEKNISFNRFDVDRKYRFEFFNQPDGFSKLYFILNYNCQLL